MYEMLLEQHVGNYEWEVSRLQMVEHWKIHGQERLARADNDDWA